MTHRIYFIISLLLLPFMGKAQLHKELLANGGFEQYAKSDTPPSTGDEDGDEDGDGEERKKTLLTGIKSHSFAKSATS